MLYIYIHKRRGNEEVMYLLKYEMKFFNYLENYLPFPPNKLKKSARFARTFSSRASRAARKNERA